MVRKFCTDEKGVKSLATTGDVLVDFFFKAVRGLTLENIQGYITKICNSKDEETLVDMFVMAFQTRDITKGKGERDLFYSILLECYILYPKLVTNLLGLISSKYGSFLDFNKLLFKLDGLITTSKNDQEKCILYKSLAIIIMEMYCKAIFANKGIIDQNSTTGMNLSSKWAPREDRGLLTKKYAHLMALMAYPIPSEFNELVESQNDDDSFVSKIASIGNHSYSSYRKLIASTNKKLNTVEIKQCGKRWAEIEPSTVPAGCLKKNRKAFMNSNSLEDEDRIACADTFTKHMVKAVKGEAKVHGAVLHAHDIVRQCYSGQDNVLEAQWIDLRSKFTALGKYVALSDVSGSMSGTPMEVSIALGILISELTHPAFRDRFITFESTPRWHKLPSNGSLYDKVQSAKRAPWGGSTNFVAALDLILDTAVRAKLAEEDMPEALVVLSDMQFNEASGCGYYNQYGNSGANKFESKYDSIKNRFTNAGYKVPHIIFWNLRANTKDCPVESNTVGCSMVSGFSQNLLNLFCNGEILTSSYNLLYDALHDTRYDDVRGQCELFFSGGIDADADADAEDGVDSVFVNAEKFDRLTKTEALIRHCRKAVNSKLKRKDGKLVIPFPDNDGDLGYIPHFLGKGYSNIVQLEEMWRISVKIKDNKIIIDLNDNGDVRGLEVLVKQEIEEHLEAAINRYNVRVAEGVPSAPSTRGRGRGRARGRGRR